MSMDQGTPRLIAVDPRRLPVRSVDYCRTLERGPAHRRINRSRIDTAGRLVEQWDPRLWALRQEDEATPANLSAVYSLSSTVLLTTSVDAGRQVDLPGLASENLRSWDGRGTQREIAYDHSLRLVAVFEQGAGQPRRCVERMKYGDPGQGDGDHNQHGQLVRHDDPAGTVLSTSFSLGGQRLAQERRFTLDAVIPDWPEREADREPLLEPGDGFLTTWCLGPQGDVLEQVDARGNRQRQTLAVDGRMAGSQLLLRGQSQWQSLVRDIRYSAEGQVEEQTAGNAVRTRLAYSPEDGRLVTRSVRHGDRVLQDLEYAYDPMGNVLSIEDKAQPVRYFANQRIEPVSRFVYDTLYQLSQATGWEAGAPSQGPESMGHSDPAAVSNYRQTYRYDEGGNLVELTHVGAQNHGQRMKVARHSNRGLPYRNGVPPTEEEIDAAFDAQGNWLEREPGRSLAWDLRNQLGSVTPIARASGLDDSERYVYAGDGQRVRKLRTLQTASRTLVAEVRYLPGLELRADSGNGESLQVIVARGGLDGVRILHWESTPPFAENDRYRYSCSDHLGSIALELDHDARIISREHFYPFGETAYLAGDDEAEVSYKTVRYSGKERDATGLYYYGFRYYAPWLQRWVNPDPAGEVDGLNLYRMVRNNPVTFFDTDGLAPQPEGKPKDGSNVSRIRQAFESSKSASDQLPQVRQAPLIRTARPPLKQLPQRTARVQVSSMEAFLPVGKVSTVHPESIRPTGSLSPHVGSQLLVGSHALTITQAGNIIVMRGDNRSPDEIRRAGGFFPRDNRGLKIKQEFREALMTKGFNTLANEHVRSPVPGYVSTGMDEDSGGYGDTRNYLYRMEIPGLEERSVDQQTLGIDKPFKFVPKGRLDARLLMSNDTLDQANFVAMIPPMTVEVTFITPIPSAYIVSFRKAGSREWESFH
ncbi:MULTISPECIES: RHS repeat domain-containing protein [unclassified Pseudomonas]|uniref:RHS repeat domain-containing protein n=1 Tax=unclassified Pseudomonas TaxID=196821 RepID=UPI0009229446|nr:MULTISPECIES: RHS repeat-associated core domain-containing protein [unclassified Pseudomonas]SFX86588.1 insecticidal toxin complex protein TccC [Pseudomonas sp. NFACC47-1]SFY33753.1 insecticidal toxin complex protein TccC [Pseudomonas sp. NFACC43]